ncbi:MAG: GxxExxY protein [Acidobacteriia bacterium]|nr:GxxExxY protein [Terriglobia bacterium]
MDTNEHESLDALIAKVIGAAYEVSNTLGCGFLENVYHAAMVRELALRGLGVRSGVPYWVEYKGEFVAKYIADIVVNDKLILELKCVEQFAREHLAQCINYLKASGLRIALLINFKHPKVKWKRVIYGF